MLVSVVRAAEKRVTSVEESNGRGAGTVTMGEMCADVSECVCAWKMGDVQMSISLSE